MQLFFEDITSISTLKNDFGPKYLNICKALKFHYSIKASNTGGNPCDLEK